MTAVFCRRARGAATQPAFLQRNQDFVMIDFKGAAKRLADIDLPRIGQTIGVGEDEIHAVLEVESSGHGFDSQGRPTILFEPHVFYRNLSGDKRARAVSAGLAYEHWKAGNYPK